MLERIDGRRDDLVVASDGSRFPLVALNLHTNVYDNVDQYQFVQAQPGRLTLRLVRRPAYNERDTQRILAELSRQAGPRIELTVEFVSRIDRSRSGKLSVLEQRLPPSVLSAGGPAA